MRPVARAYARVIDIYVDGEIPTDAFVYVFMALWGTVSAPSLGPAGRKLHQLFTLLEGVDLDLTLNEPLFRETVDRMSADRHSW